jgi:hypothetical protein
MLPPYDFSRRGGGLMILPERVERDEPLHLLVDSTGIKIYGEGEWLDQKHGVRSCRRWRKLHLAVAGRGNVMKTGATMFQCFCYIRSAEAIQSGTKAI